MPYRWPGAVTSVTFAGSGGGGGSAAAAGAATHAHAHSAHVLVGCVDAAGVRAASAAGFATADGSAAPSWSAVSGKRKARPCERDGERVRRVRV